MIDWDKYRSPLELARQLWHIPNMTELTCLPPSRFQTLFDRVYQSTDDEEALWRLGGATNDYLRANPGSFCVPAELPRRLLASQNVDARVVGLKLLNRCSASDEEVVAAITNALRRRDDYESNGGMVELSNFLDRRIPMEAKLEQSMAETLLCALEPLVEDGDNRHFGAPQVMARIKDLLI
ncbi:MAG: hypothetical protein WDZ51_04590 [Pirellulaceae bacterium]